MMLEQSPQGSWPKDAWVALATVFIILAARLGLLLFSSGRSFGTLLDMFFNGGFGFAFGWFGRAIWLTARRVPKSNRKTEKTGVP
jgi:hypothetical protein